MTKSDIMHLLGERAIEAQNHLAWEPFCILMSNKQYGYEPLISAWAFFKQGWDECGKVTINL